MILNIHRRGRDRQGLQAADVIAWAAAPKRPSTKYRVHEPRDLNRCASFDQQPRFEGEWPTMGS